MVWTNWAFYSLRLGNRLVTPCRRQIGANLVALFVPLAQKKKSATNQHASVNTNFHNEDLERAKIGVIDRKTFPTTVLEK